MFNFMERSRDTCRRSVEWTWCRHVKQINELVILMHLQVKRMYNRRAKSIHTMQL